MLAAHSIYFQVLGDSGFVGLFLFMGLLLAWFVSLRRTKAMTQGRAEMRWAFDLAAALERSLMVYLVSGGALSAAYFENVYIEIVLASMVLACVRASAPERAPDAVFNRR